MRLGLSLIFLLMLGGCSKEVFKLQYQPKTPIPQDAREIYINEIDLDDIFLKVSLQTKLFNISNVNNKSYIVITNKKMAKTIIDIKILNNTFQNFPYNKIDKHKQKYIRCNSRSHKLKVLVSSYDAKTKKIFSYDIFDTISQNEDCGMKTTMKEQLEEKSVDTIVKQMVDFFIPKSIMISITPARMIDRYSKEETKLFNEALEYLENKEFEEAKVRFLTLSYIKDDYSVNFNLALCYELMKDYSSAIKRYSMASDAFIPSIDKSIKNEAQKSIERLSLVIKR
jgi:tetratricopeptide (TPR) repeat protein